MDNRFLGVPYPITKDARGYFRSQGGIDQIKSDLYVLLMTNPGERVMLPTFGAGLRDLLFEQNDVSLQSRARQLIIDAIKNWEPRIALDQVQISSSVNQDSALCGDNEADATLSVKILFHDPENLQSVQELVFKVPLQGV